jgi:hypothetical protein
MNDELSLLPVRITLFEHRRWRLTICVETPAAFQAGHSVTTKDFGLVDRSEKDQGEYAAER